MYARAAPRAGHAVGAYDNHHADRNPHASRHNPNSHHRCHPCPIAPATGNTADSGRGTHASHGHAHADAYHTHTGG